MAVLTAQPIYKQYLTDAKNNTNNNSGVKPSLCFANGSPISSVSGAPNPGASASLLHDSTLQSATLGTTGPLNAAAQALVGLVSAESSVIGAPGNVLNPTWSTTVAIPAQPTSATLAGGVSQAPNLQ